MQTQLELTTTSSHSDPASLADALPPDALAVIGHLGRHCLGPERAATAAQIAAAIGLSAKDAARQVRELVSLYHDQFPFIVCGAGGAGYFVATAPDQLTHEYRSLYSRLSCIALRLRSLNLQARRHGYQREGAGPRSIFHAPSSHPSQLSHAPNNERSQP